MSDWPSRIWNLLVRWIIVSDWPSRIRNLLDRWMERIIVSSWPSRIRNLLDRWMERIIVSGWPSRIRNLFDRWMERIIVSGWPSRIGNLLDRWMALINKNKRAFQHSLRKIDQLFTHDDVATLNHIQQGQFYQLKYNLSNSKSSVLRVSSFWGNYWTCTQLQCNICKVWLEKILLFQLIFKISMIPDFIFWFRNMLRIYFELIFKNVKAFVIWMLTIALYVIVLICFVFVCKKIILISRIVY